MPGLRLVYRDSDKKNCWVLHRSEARAGNHRVAATLLQAFDVSKMEASQTHPESPDICGPFDDWLGAFSQDSKL